MTANSVSGSFRGIEVSFSYSGPHIVMSVLNRGEDGRRLRVMFQHQPLSGRVNWTSFQLTGFSQDVVVPQEVIQSHKLAFYVDHHEPIATFTEKVLEELNQIRDKQPSDSKHEHKMSELSEETPMDVGDLHINGRNNADEIVIQQQPRMKEDVTPETNSDESVKPSIPQYHDDDPTEKTLNSECDNPNPDQEVHVNIEPKNTDVNVNADLKDAAISENEQNKTAAPVNSEDTKLPKRKTQYIGQYIPDVSTELQFKIKVPLIPKSASKKKQTTFIPPRTSSTSISNGNKNGFLGQLVGAFGINFTNKKKQFYIQQNQHLHEKFHADLDRLQSDYNNGCGIPLDNWDLESLSEQQTAVLLLNLMVNEISEWKKDAKKSNATKDSLAKSLETIGDELKQTLKQTRGINAPAPTLFPDRTASTDQDLEHIQKDCDSYLERFSEKLALLEQNHAEKVRVSAFKKYLLEFVRDKLFPNVAKFGSLKSVQSRLNWFLSLVDYELMPIEPGKTKFSPEFHEAKDKRSCEFESDTIVEVVSPGLQLKGGKRIIQNAVVIQAE